MNSFFRGRLLTEPITNSCNSPYQSITIDTEGNCLICSCEGHLPVPVGNVLDFDTIDQVWQSPVAKIIQRDVDEKKFTWCAVNDCGIRYKPVDIKRFELYINLDDSCNLQCPSCRKESIMHSSGPVFEHRQAVLQRILEWLEKFNKRIFINLMSNGDPLASHIIRPLFKNYQPKPDQTFGMITNGLLIRKHLLDSKLFPQIETYSISVDAGSADVYEKVRRPGKWSVLMDNFDFLKENNKSHLVKLIFIVQRDTYQDLENFVRLCVQYGFLGQVISLRDFGTWTPNNTINPDAWSIKNGTYQEHNVLDTVHPEHETCKKLLKSIYEQHQGLNKSNIFFEPALMHKLGLNHNG